MQVDTQNKEFQDALKLIQYTRQSVFLTGKAGTGKSTFLKYVCEITKKKHIVLAPTGIAAINAGGSTLHSFFFVISHTYFKKVDLPVPAFPVRKTDWRVY